ncbi:glycosyltransferase [Saccharopolyspora sp. WRP15-2]|uniref:Glycosyltransferase n=1 Tax=Saccharopolyspora oryzae TaxID=2997343 RepID=A0ABT4VAG3_9PSEU|nr:glycosyltransferase [Saccharopolyspora oryzae]MDA3630967.1 glycosyltransferase [Saccharopolyspora oryzae]
MRLLVVALGSRGDVVPALGLAPALIAAGYEVTIAANPEFGGLVREAGAGFVALPGDARTISSFPRGWRSSPRFLAAQARALTTYLIDAVDAVVDAAPGHHVLLPNLTARFADDVAEGLGIPSIGLYAQPAEPTAAFPPILLHTARDLGGVANRFSARVAMAVATPFHAAARRARAAVGLPARRRAPRLNRVLHGWSPHVLARPVDWRPGLSVAGYWRPRIPPGWAPPAELVDFLDAGEPPVLIGFGSMAAGQDGWLSDVVARAVRGRRAIVQRGWAGLEAAGPDVLVVGDVPHDWLFPRVAAVVHHGGAGTAGAVFSAGVPGVAVPVYADQPLWADRARRLGTGPDPLPFTRLTGSALAARIDAVTTSPGASNFRGAAAELAGRIAADDAVGPVLAALAELPGSPG